MEMLQSGKSSHCIVTMVRCLRQRPTIQMLYWLIAVVLAWSFYNSEFTTANANISLHGEIKSRSMTVNTHNSLHGEIESNDIPVNRSSFATLGAHAYAQSFSSLDRRLLFAHIPKTAGSTMEIDVAKQGNLTWGRCMFLDGARSCPRVKEAKNRFGRSKQQLRPYWHIPVHYFPVHNFNPYNAETFAVIRHPVDRAVSEYHYMCTREAAGLRKHAKKRCTNMTDFILNRLDRKNAKNFDLPFGISYHWISQRDFIVGPFETRTVDYILQMEEMSPSFERLATAFGLPELHWPTARTNAANHSKSVSELPDNLADVICNVPNVVDDLLLWNTCSQGRNLSSKTNFGHLCEASISATSAVVY
jgi:hypothetical protein